MTTLRRLIRRLLGIHNEELNITIRTLSGTITISIDCDTCGTIHDETIRSYEYSPARVDHAIANARANHNRKKNR